jgi:hypothetical protein
MLPVFLFFCTLSLIIVDSQNGGDHAAWSHYKLKNL